MYDWACETIAALIGKAHTETGMAFGTGTLQMMAFGVRTSLFSNNLPFTCVSLWVICVMECIKYMYIFYLQLNAFTFFLLNWFYDVQTQVGSYYFNIMCNTEQTLQGLPRLSLLSHYRQHIDTLRGR